MRKETIFVVKVSIDDHAVNKYTSSKFRAKQIAEDMYKAACTLALGDLIEIEVIEEEMERSLEPITEVI